MARSIRFHLDENCSKAIAKGLRLRGIDVTTTPQVGLRGVTDEEQLEFAASTMRILFTQDRDLLRFQAVPHAGIAYCGKDTRGIGEIIEVLALIWDLYEPEEMTGRVEFF